VSEWWIMIVRILNTVVRNCSYIQRLGDAVAAASSVSSVSCPCSACSGTRLWWRADWVPSSRRAVPSSVRQVAGWRRSTCAACEAVSRSAPSVSASSSDRSPCATVIRSAKSVLHRHHPDSFHLLRPSFITDVLHSYLINLYSGIYNVISNK